MAKNTQSSFEEDYFESDPMRSARRQKRKARRHRTKEFLRDLAKGKQEDDQVYDDYDTFEEFRT